MADSFTAPRRRRWPWVLLALVVLAAGLWVAGWYYAIERVERTTIAWKEREARSGRIHDCRHHDVSGFPFRIVVRCMEPTTRIRAEQPLSLAASEIVVKADVFAGAVLDSDIIGPLTIRTPGQPLAKASWRSARTQVRGLATSPESATVRLEEPVFERMTDSGSADIYRARFARVDGRMLEGSARANPVIELTLKLEQATAPSLHPALQRPADADITAVLRGLKDFGPKSWAARFRELQAANGRIEVTKARVAQGDIIVVADGVLSLSANGRPDGELRLVVANLQQLIALLGLDKMMAQDAPQNRLGSAVGALDRVVPGLGNFARQNATPALVASLMMLGKQTELEGQRAVALPLRFSDGRVMLGPLLVAQIPALF